MNSEKCRNGEQIKNTKQRTEKFMDEKCEWDLCFVMAPHCASLIFSSLSAHK